MSKKLDKLRKRTSALLHAYLNCTDGYLEPDASPVVGFFKSVLECCDDIADVWDADTAYESLLGYLSHHLEEKKDQDITPELCDRFITEFKKFMMKNVEETWVLVPVGKLQPLLPSYEYERLHAPVEFDRFLILPSQMSRDEKLDVLAEKLPRSRDDLLDIASHCERTISQYYFENTLFCVCLTHQFNWVATRFPVIAITSVGILRAMFFSEAKFDDIEEVKVFASTYCLSDEQHLAAIRHVIIIGERNHDCRHVDNADLACRFPMGWLNVAANQNRLGALLDSLVLKCHRDKLEFRFARSFQVLSQSVEMGRSTTGLAAEFLFLMVAAESILLKRNDEKRLRLSYLLPLFGRPPGVLQKEGYEAVNKCYKWRSDYVHTGQEIFPEYYDTFDHGEPRKLLYLVRRMVARLLVLAPELIDLADNRLEAGVDPKSTRDARQKAWHEYIDECWRAAFTEDKRPPGLDP